MHLQTNNDHSTGLPPRGGHAISRQGTGAPLAPLLTRREIRRIVADLIG